MDAAVAAHRRELASDAEASEAGERDEETVVVGFAEGDEAAEAADGEEGGAGGAVRMGGVGLDHAEEAAVAERVLHECQVARLEDVEREAGARQEERAGEREDGEFRCEIGEARCGRRHRRRGD